MKRLSCFCLAFLLLVLAMTWTWGDVMTYAADSPESSLNFSSETVDFSCRLDVETSKIHLGGTIRHDVFVMNSDYTIEVYAVPPGEDAKELICDPNTVPVASSKIAIRFEFAIDAKDVPAKYSRYCVVLRSPDGLNCLASESKFAEVVSTFREKTDDRSAYKGIVTSQVAAASAAGAGRVILPVDLERLISKTSSGYVYQAGTRNIYFDQAYMEMLDINVRSATVAGAEVYLQYLSPTEADGGIPNVYDAEVLTVVEAVTSFLCERYENLQSGMLNGVIVGKAVDRTILAVCTDKSSLEQYAEKYALYVIAVANAARRIRSDMDVVLPFSSDNRYQEDMGDSLTPSLLLKTVLATFDRSFSEPFACTSMIESSTLPLIYPHGWESYEQPLQPIQDNATFHVGNIQSYANYLEQLRMYFMSAPSSFMFVWQVPESLSGNALCATYAYSYFRMLTEKGLSSFVVSFAEREQGGNYRGFSELSHVYTYVDTSESLLVTKNLLSYFHASSWLSIGEISYEGEYVFRTLYQTIPLLRVPDHVKGSFSYFDFSTSVNLNTWFFGNACQDIRLDYHASGGKALKMEMVGSDGYAEAFCLYEYPENFIYTPYVAFRVCVEPSEKTSAELYEVLITSGTGRTSIVGAAAISAGGTHTLVLDLSNYISANMSDYWRIAVRPLDGECREYSLWIYDVVGYSTEWSDAELKEKIETERRRIRELENDDDEDGSGYERLWTIIGIIAVVLMIGIGIFIFMYTNNDSDYRAEREEKNNES